MVEEESAEHVGAKKDHDDGDDGDDGGDAKKIVVLSKRQRRKQPNEKNKWTQHPKIQAMDAREKAYIRVAGFGTTTTSNNKKKSKKLFDPELDLMSPEVKFGRKLGSTDQRERHKAVNTLKLYLKARSDINNKDGGLSELDLLKLWKALWYTIYMCDKVAVQQELSKHLASLLWCLVGTEEEDEYAAQQYVDMNPLEEDEDDEEDIDAEAEEEDNDDDDDEDNDEDVIMEEFRNFLSNYNDDGGSNNEDDDSSHEVDGSDIQDDAILEDDSEDEENDDYNDYEEEEEDDDDDVMEIDEREIRHCRGAHLVSIFVKVFFITIRREWGKMDKYRIDKFYTLIRLCIHEIFKYFAIRHWDFGIIQMFNDVMFDEVLSQTPSGPRLHLIDIVVEELSKVNANEAPAPLTEANFLDVLEPYFALCQTGGGRDGGGFGRDDTLQNRVMENVLQKFLFDYSVVSERAIKERNQDDNDDVSEDDDGKGTNGDKDEQQGQKSLVLDQVHVGTVAEFIFSLASSPDTSELYRKSLYKMHKEYNRRLQKVGVDVELPEELQQQDDDDEDVGEENYDPEVSDKVASDEDEEEEGKKKEQEETSASAGEVKISKTEKKKKKQRKRKAAAKTNAEDEEESRNDTARNDRKKKKRRESSNSHESPAGKGIETPDSTTNGKQQEDEDDGDELITISLSEQKQAREKFRAMKMKERQEEEGKSKGSSRGAATQDKSKGRRVQFGKANRSKSYKASMKALVTRDLPKTSKKATPEKGILLNKGKKIRISKSHKSGRKRAVNYF